MQAKDLCASVATLRRSPLREGGGCGRACDASMKTAGRAGRLARPAAKPVRRVSVAVYAVLLFLPLSSFASDRYVNIANPTPLAPYTDGRLRRDRRRQRVRHAAGEHGHRSHRRRRVVQGVQGRGEVNTEHRTSNIERRRFQVSGFRKDAARTSALGPRPSIGLTLTSDLRLPTSAPRSWLFALCPPLRLTPRRRGRRRACAA